MIRRKVCRRALCKVIQENHILSLMVSARFYLAAMVGTTAPQETPPRYGALATTAAAGGLR